jgi:hypothetical protein
VLVTLYQTTRRHNLQGHDLNLHRRGNVKAYRDVSDLFYGTETNAAVYSVKCKVMG